MKSTESFPEIFCDFNARMTENGYSLGTTGSRADLAKLGLTLEQAVGRRFILNGGLDANEHGEPAHIMCIGVVVKDARWGYLAVAEPGSFFWRDVGRGDEVS